VSIVLQFAILGIATGGLIALLSVGIVVVYRGSRVVNFAQGALGMVGTYAFYDLHYNHHFDFAVSLIVGVAVSALLAFATHVLVMVPMRNTPQVSRIIASIAVLEVQPSLFGSHRWREPSDHRRHRGSDSCGVARALQAHAARPCDYRGTR
jgi:branched-subunit amino acid ABC-type transport system permease component